MTPPFSTEDFFAVFVAYNTGVWPAQVLLNVAAAGAVVLAIRGPAWQGRAIFVILAMLWMWMGIVYHWAYFSALNPAARAFAAAFVAQGLLLAYIGLRPARVQVGPSRDLFGSAGAVLIGYALVVYPLIGAAIGHRYPAQPTFGLPCPTTIFTMGVLLWTRPSVPWTTLIVPGVWSVIGLSAVRYFGVVEDAMLPVAAILGGALILRRSYRTSRIST